MALIVALIDPFKGTLLKGTPKKDPIKDPLKDPQKDSIAIVTLIVILVDPF